MKSLNDLLHLHDLLSLETSNYSNNVAKMPVPGYGTRDVPGRVSLWILSLGTQKDSILQWLGRDELSKHKLLEPAVKYIRSKLVEGRLQSEARQDFDSKLTPIRYEDIRHTQGESNTRQQINFYSKPHNKFPHQPTNARDHILRSQHLTQSMCNAYLADTMMTLMTIKTFLRQQTTMTYLKKKSTILCLKTFRMIPSWQFKIIQPPAVLLPVPSVVTAVTCLSSKNVPAVPPTVLLTILLLAKKSVFSHTNYLPNENLVYMANYPRM
jgi:hypothetical protein